MKPFASAAPSFDYIPGLDGLRACAVMIVILAHLGFHAAIPGGFGVTLFFFISGMLITRLLLAEQALAGGPIGKLLYHVSRFQADEILIAGKLAYVAEHIAHTRAAAREVNAPSAGVIDAIAANEGAEVTAGAPLVPLELDLDEQAAAPQWDELELADLDLPWLRIYGRLDSLVPKAAIPLLDERYPASRSLVLEKASHAPFISHPEPFITLLRQFIG